MTSAKVYPLPAYKIYSLNLGPFVLRSSVYTIPREILTPSPHEWTDVECGSLRSEKQKQVAFIGRGRRRDADAVSDGRKRQTRPRRPHFFAPPPAFTRVHGGRAGSIQELSAFQPQM